MLRYREEETDALEAAQSQRDMWIHEATERTQERDSWEEECTGCQPEIGTALDMLILIDNLT
eukprot:964879-Amphidinium_carterae.1